MPPGAAPHRGRFLVRNRLIAALSRGTVVVEAALRSGSLSTAHEAERLGRPVLGVPGPVTSEQSRGVHRILREGALLVTSAAEVAEAVGGIGVDLAPDLSGPVDPRDALDPLAARVLDSVPVRRGATLESVARTAGVTPAETAAALGLLELSGFVRHGVEGWTLARPAARRVDSGRVRADGGGVSTSAEADSAAGDVDEHLPAELDDAVGAFAVHLDRELGRSPHTVRAYVGDVTRLLRFPAPGSRPSRGPRPDPTSAAGCPTRQPKATQATLARRAAARGSSPPGPTRAGCSSSIPGTGPRRRRPTDRCRES